MKENIRRWLTGLSFPQEYVCLDRSTFGDQLKTIVTNDDTSMDGRAHVFLGYKPLIIALHFSSVQQDKALNENKETWRMKFLTASDEQIAYIDLREVHQFGTDQTRIILYRGIYGRHTFLSRFHQAMLSIKTVLTKRKSGDADLSGNNYEQVRIAYAVPRTISLIVVCADGMMNMFPTDLHGPVGTTHYISSLRIQGMANQQVQTHRRIVVADVEAEQYQTVYSMGRNHMKPLRSCDQFQTNEDRSLHFQYPLPSGTVAYRELLQINSWDYGIHRIHLYEVVHHERIGSSLSLLAHIHQYYAQWRVDRHVPSSFLLR